MNIKKIPDEERCCIKCGCKESRLTHLYENDGKLFCRLCYWEERKSKKAKKKKSRRRK